MTDRYIAVAGNIGAGKTSLVQYLATEYGFQPIYEPFADNPYLDDFYRDMSAWAFHSQVWFLAHKYRLHRELHGLPGTLVQDRTIYEDAEIFATYLHRSRRINRRDFDTYMEMYRAMRPSLRPPDLMIYLRCPVRTIRRRIVQRGRPSEQDIPTAYLRKLNLLYDEWLDRWTASPVLVWQTDELDYLGDLVGAVAFRRAMAQLLA